MLGSRFARSALCGLALAIAACGTTPTGETSASADGGQDNVDAADVSADAAGATDAGADAEDVAAVVPWADYFPQTLSSGGHVLVAPVIQPVFFAGEDAAKKATLTDFLGKLPGSDYWKATTSEYGVGDVAVNLAVTVTTTVPATLTDDALRAWLTSAIQTQELPAPVIGTIYTLYYPAGTTVLWQGQKSCVDYGGYHGEVSVNGKQVVFAVIPHCESYAGHPPLHFPQGVQLAGADFLTGLSSHELIEAATNPFVDSSPAFKFIDIAHFAWANFLFASEVGDTCPYISTNTWHKDPQIGAMVQSTWSNAAALAGKDPCVPSATPYVGAFPRLTQVKVKGKPAFAVVIPVDTTATVLLDFAAEDPSVGEWSIAAVDLKSQVGGPPRLDLSLDKTHGKHGDVATLTIHAISHDGTGMAAFFIESTIGGRMTRVPGLVIKH